MSALRDEVYDTNTDPDRLIEAGLERYGAADHAAAERLFRLAASAAPDDPTALYLLGLLRFEQGDAAGAEPLLEQVAAMRPDHARAQLTLACVRRSRDDHVSAAAGFRRVLALEPENLDAQVFLSQSLLASGEARDAAATAAAAVRLAPAAAAARLALAEACSCLGWPREAASAYHAASELAPDSAQAWAGLAGEQLKLGETVAARDSAERAVALDPALGGAWFVLGDARRALGVSVDALNALERAIALGQSGAAVHFSAGLACADLDRQPDAVRHLLAAQALVADDPQIEVALCTAYHRMGRNAEFKAHARRALEIDPQMVAAHQAMAGLLAEEGSEAEARAHRDQAYGGGRSLLVAEAARPELRVLVLTTSASGNTPDRYLLPAARYTRLFWVIEYAGEDQFAALPPYDVVFNAIADPDSANTATLAKAQRFVQACERRVINDPRRIAQTGRDMTPHLLAGLEGVLTPAAIRVSAEAASSMGLVAAAELGGIGAPFLARPIGSHGGEGLQLITEGGSSGPPAATGEHYLTAFHDFRSADGFYRKYRVFFVGGRALPYHLAISTHWLVHYGACGMESRPEHLAEEARFLENPEAAIGAAAMAAVRAIGERMGLDFCGVDFSVLADGRVIVFEANATMLAHPEAPDGPLAHKNPYVARILDAFGAMLAGR